MLPKPISFCSVVHNGNLFPDMVLRLTRAGADAPNNYAFVAVLKTKCCAGCGVNDIACDPTLCEAELGVALVKALATDHPVASFGAAAGRRYSAYYDREILGIGKRGKLAQSHGAINDILGEIFGDKR